MKFSVLSLVAVSLALCYVEAQRSNYILLAYEAAMETVAEYDFERDFFRALLTWESNNVGSIFVTILSDGIDHIQTEAQGDEMRLCAERTATASQNYLNRMDDLLRKLESDMTNLHLTVFQQLIDTNIKAESVELFYYYHGLRLEEALSELDEQSVVLHDAYTDIYFSFFDEFYALEACINNVVNMK